MKIPPSASIFLTSCTIANALTLLQPTSTVSQQRSAYPATRTRPAFAAEAFEDVILGRQVTFSNPTCGYIGADSASPITCAASFECGYFPSAVPNFGCCSGGVTDACGYVSTCQNYHASGNSYSASGVQVVNAEFQCGVDYPSCTTYLLYGSNTQESYYSYNCGTGVETTITAYPTATGASSSSSTSSTTPTSKQSPSAATATSSSSSGGLSTGAEVGIGVGVAVGVIAVLLAGLVWFCLKRRRRNQIGRNNQGGWQGRSNEPHEPDSMPLHEMGDHQGQAWQQRYSDSGYFAKPKYAEAETPPVYPPQELDAGHNAPSELSSAPQRR